MTTLKYVPITKAIHYDYAVGDLVLMPPSVSATESAPTPKKTGLLNEHGIPLYRVEEKIKMGFL